MNSINEAQQEEDELTRLIESSFNTRARRYYHYLRSMIELKKEEYSKSIEYLNEAIRLEPHGLQKNAEFVESLARAYLLNEYLDKAEEEYVRIANLTSGRLYDGDIYAKSFYMLGKIYEQQNDSAQAIEYYEKFLDLWKDADPGLPEVADARERVAALRQQ